MPQLLPTADVTTTNVVVGFANLYTAPLDTTMPTATKALNAAWPDGWINPGATTEGVTLSREPTTNEISIEEEAIPVLETVDTVKFTMSCTLSEDTLQNMLLAYGAGSIGTTAPTDSDPGYSTLTLADQINSIMVGIEAENTFSLARIIVIPIAVVTAKADTVYRRAKSPRTYTFTAQALCPQSQILIVDQTAAAS